MEDVKLRIIGEFKDSISSKLKGLETRLSSLAATGMKVYAAGAALNVILIGLARHAANSG